MLRALFSTRSLSCPFVVRVDAKPTGEQESGKPADMPAPTHSVYSRDQTSPDGTLHIRYAYVDGERSPQIVEPRITLTATGEVILDLWRGCIDGSVDGFSPGGFRLTLRDPYGPTILVAIVDLASRRFAIEGEPGATYALASVSEVMGARIAVARDAFLAAHRAANPPAVPATFFRRILHALWS